MFGNDGTLDECNLSLVSFGNNNELCQFLLWRAHPNLHGAPEFAVIDLTEFLGNDTVPASLSKNHKYGSSEFTAITSFTLVAIELA
jgi:hypothetical protein